MQQVSQIISCLLTPSYLRYGKPAVVLGRLALALARWTSRSRGPASPSIAVQQFPPPGTSTSPLKPTPTVPLQVESVVPIASTLAAASVCLAFILVTFYTFLRTSQTAESSETSPPLSEALVDARSLPVASCVSWLTWIRPLLKLHLDTFEFFRHVMETTLGRFQMPPYVRKSPPRLSVFFRIRTKASSTYLGVLESMSGLIPPPLQTCSSSPTSFRLPITQSMLAFCSPLKWTRCIFELGANLIPQPYSHATRLTRGLSRASFFNFATTKLEWVRLRSPAMRISGMACQSVITYGCLACSLLACLTAADILNRNTLKAIHRGVTVLVTPSPEVQLFHFIVACNFVIIGIDLSDRLLVHPGELIVVYDRLRILANGRTRREVGHERTGINEVKTIAFMAVIFCASGLILCGVAENIFPDLGFLIVPVVFMVIMIIRDAYLIHTSTPRKPMLRVGVLPEIIVDPGNHAFEFIIDGGDDLVDPNEEVRGGGDNGNGDHDESIYRHRFNPADRSGGKCEERKGVG